jgi:GNAT superfamily N-acetyltransferase
VGKEFGDNVSVGVPLTMIPTRPSGSRREDEERSDPGGPLFPHFVGGSETGVHKAGGWDESEHPRDEGGKWTAGGPIDPRKEDKAHTFGGNLAIRHRVSLTLETLQYDKRTVSVSDLEVPPERRGKGLGAKIMRKITDYADRRGLRLTLDPALGGDAGGTTSRARLVRFYRQFGFVENKGRHADDSVNFEMYRLPAVRKEQWSGGGNNPADGDSFSVGPGVVGGHTFVVGQLKDGVYVADPKHPRVNPYEALFLKRGVALKAWSDEARAAALEARRQREDDRLADRFTERPADRRARLRGMRVDRETEDRVRAALGMRPRKSAAWDESEHPRDEGGKFSESGSAHPLLIQRFKTWHKADAAARQVALDTGREAEVYHDASAEAGRKYSIGLVPGRSEQARREGEDDDTYLARLIGKSAASEGDDRFRAEEGTANPDSRKPRKYPDVGEEMGWNDSYLSKSQVEFVRVFRAAGGWEESEHPRDEGGKFSETSGGAIGERHPDPDPVPGGHTTEELKTSLRDVSGEAFVSPDGQTYGATKDVIASHVEIARALGSNVSDLINAGYVRARVDSASVGVELDMRNPTAIGNAIALLQANPDAEFVHIDPSLTADKYVPARSFSGVRPAGDAARWLRSLLPVEKAEPDTKRVVKKRDIMWQVDEPAEVEPTEGEARGTDGKVRLKDCFRQAGRYVMTHLDSLVHGTVTIGPSVPVSHAWVEIRRPDGAELIYDGVQGKFYDKASYYRNMRAVPERTYDQAEAIAKMLETRHFGPWHRSAGL